MVHELVMAGVAHTSRQSIAQARQIFLSILTTDTPAIFAAQTITNLVEITAMEVCVFAFIALGPLGHAAADCQSGKWAPNSSKGGLLTDDGDISKYYGRETLGTYRPSGFNGPMNCRTQAEFIVGSTSCWVFKVSSAGRLSTDQYHNSGAIYQTDWCTLDSSGFCSKSGWNFNVTPVGVMVNYVLVPGGWLP